MSTQLQVDGVPTAAADITTGMSTPALRERAASEECSSIPEATNETQEDREEFPIELQLEEVDMNDPDMDPLEWMVRKTIPIPKKYYWETGNNDLPARTKAWHCMVGVLGKALNLIDRVGKPVTDGMGITTSRFDYVTSTMTEEEWERARMAETERRLRAERREALECGGDGNSIDAFVVTDEVPCKQRTQ